MKLVIIDKMIQVKTHLLGLVRQATEVLDVEMGESRLKDKVVAVWGLESSPSDSWPDLSISLTLLGDGQPIVEKFTPDELEDRSYLHGRMLKLWGDYLQNLSHQQLQEMRANSSSDRFLEGSDAMERIIDTMTEYSESKGREPVLLKLPVRYAAALMKLGPKYWGDFYQGIQQSGLRAFEGQTLLGMKVELVPGADATLEVA